MSKALLISYGLEIPDPPSAIEPAVNSTIDVVNDVSSNSKEPKIMYLGGDGGTGKSRVVEALLNLSEICGRPGTVRTCVPTGIAASLVQGQKFHSLSGLRGNSDFNLKKKPSPKSVRESSGIVLLIVDEVSMLSCRNLGALSSHLKLVMERNAIWGHPYPAVW